MQVMSRFSFKIISNLIAISNMHRHTLLFLLCFIILPLKYPVISVGGEHMKKFLSFCGTSLNAHSV